MIVVGPHPPGHTLSPCPPTQVDWLPLFFLLNPVHTFKSPQTAVATPQGTDFSSAFAEHA